MKNNKGFTLIELAVTFCLVATISLILFQLVSSLKNLYLSGNIKTTLLGKQGILIKKMGDDFHDLNLNSVTSCGLSCLTFTYDTKTVTFVVDPGNRTITYDNYTYQLDNTSQFGKLSLTVDETSPALSTSVDSVLVLDIPISSKLIEGENFGIHIIKTYNRKNTSINTTLAYNNTDNIVKIGGLDTKLELLFNTQNTSSLDGAFIRIYHQDSGKYVTSYENFIKNKKEVQSALIGLSSLKKKKNNTSFISSLTTSINNSNLSSAEKKRKINRITEGYQSGYYTLLLNYNGTALTDRKYFLWNQTNNFANKETIEGYYGISNSLNNGLTYNESPNSFANIEGTQYGIGVISGDIQSNSGTVNSVDLYAEAREYICQYSLSTITYNGADIKSLSYSDGTIFCS